MLEKLSKHYELYIVTAYLWRETYDLSAQNLVYKYTHPGVFRQFTFVENTTKVKTDITGQQITEIVPKKVSESFWSCCMNSDPDSKGCQKIATKNFKWNA